MFDLSFLLRDGTAELKLDPKSGATLIGTTTEDVIVIVCRA